MNWVGFIVGLFWHLTSVLGFFWRLHWTIYKSNCYWWDINQIVIGEILKVKYFTLTEHFLICDQTLASQTLWISTKAFFEVFQAARMIIVNTRNEYGLNIEKRLILGINHAFLRQFIQKAGRNKIQTYFRKDII